MISVPVMRGVGGFRLTPLLLLPAVISVRITKAWSIKTPQSRGTRKQWAVWEPVPEMKRRKR